jgi:hypothetical protein
MSDRRPASRRQMVMFALGALALGLGGCAWCGWLWTGHGANPPSVRIMFLSVSFVVFGIIGLVTTIGGGNER